MRLADPYLLALLLAIPPLLFLRTRLSRRSVNDAVYRIARLQGDGLPADPVGGLAHATRRLLALSAPPAASSGGNTKMSIRLFTMQIDLADNVLISARAPSFGLWLRNR